MPSGTAAPGPTIHQPAKRDLFACPGTSVVILLRSAPDRVAAVRRKGYDMRRKLLPGLILTTCLTAPAAAESWYFIKTSDIEIDYADADSVRRTGNNVTLDMFRGFDFGQGSNGDIYFIKHNLEFACDRSEFRDIGISAWGYSRTYVTAPPMETQWRAINAGSTMDTLRGFACDGQLRSTPVADPFADAEEYWDYMYYYYGY